MKLAIVLILSLFTQTAFAASQTVSAGEIARLLVHPQVLNCVHELAGLGKRYELAGHDEGFSEVRVGTEIVTTIVFNAIQGGDMMIGDVTLTVTQGTTNVNFPEGRSTYIKGCKVSKDSRVR